MTDATQLARACAEAMYERDQATRRMGIQLLDAGPGSAKLSMRVREDMIQGHGTCHGGYLFALADSAFAFACNSYNDATVAIGCSIDYVAPAREATSWSPAPSSRAVAAAPATTTCASRTPRAN